MYLDSGNDYYVLSFPDRIIYTISGLTIKDPLIKVRLLTYPEYLKVNTLKSSNEKSSLINEEIFSACYLGLLGFEDEVLNAEDTPFILDSVASKIYNDTQEIIYKTEDYFNLSLERTRKIEIWCGFISNILNISYETLYNKPIDEIIRLYSIAYLVSGKTIPYITLEEKKDG